MITRNDAARSLRGILLLAVLLLVPYCRGSSQTSIDGETHFLRTCVAADDDCGPELTCLCGVCARACGETADCSDLSSAARCVASDDEPADACVDASTTAVCDVPCVGDDECTTLGPDYRCSSGLCRENDEVGTSGAGGAAGGAGGAGSCPSSEVGGDEVVVLGDVFVAQTGEVSAELEALAREAGALSSNENYRDYSSTTINSLTVANALLLDRFDEAAAESPVKVVVMDGGGSDLLLKSCSAAPAPDCQLMLDIVSGAEQLLDQMAGDGVEDVVWFYYPDPMDSELLAELDVLQPLLEDVCATSPVPCHFVDLQETFAGHYDDYMETDFVPTTAGAEAAATAIWSAMEEACIAQ